MDLETVVELEEAMKEAVLLLTGCIRSAENPTAYVAGLRRVEAAAEIFAAYRKFEHARAVMDEHIRAASTRSSSHQQ